MLQHYGVRKIYLLSLHFAPRMASGLQIFITTSVQGIAFISQRLEILNILRPRKLGTQWTTESEDP